MHKICIVLFSEKDNFWLLLYIKIKITFSDFLNRIQQIKILDKEAERLQDDPDLDLKQRIVWKCRQIYEDLFRSANITFDELTCDKI